MAYLWTSYWFRMTSMWTTYRNETVGTILFYQTAYTLIMYCLVVWFFPETSVKRDSHSKIPGRRWRIKWKHQAVYHFNNFVACRSLALISQVAVDCKLVPFQGISKQNWPIVLQEQPNIICRAHGSAFDVDDFHQKRTFWQKHIMACPHYKSKLSEHICEKFCENKKDEHIVDNTSTLLSFISMFCLYEPRECGARIGWSKPIERPTGKDRWIDQPLRLGKIW